MSKKLDELIDKWKDNLLFLKEEKRQTGLCEEVIEDLVALKNILFPTPLPGGESVVELQHRDLRCTVKAGDVASKCFCSGQGVKE